MIGRLHVVILPWILGAGTSKAGCRGTVLPLMTKSVRLRLEHFESKDGEAFATYAVMGRRKLASLHKTQRLSRAA